MSNPAAQQGQGSGQPQVLLVYPPTIQQPGQSQAVANPPSYEDATRGGIQETGQKAGPRDEEVSLNFR